MGENCTEYCTMDDIYFLRSNWKKKYLFIFWNFCREIDKCFEDSLTYGEVKLLRIGHLHDGVILLLRPESFPFFLSYLNFVIPVRLKYNKSPN